METGVGVGRRSEAGCEAVVLAMMIVTTPIGVVLDGVVVTTPIGVVLAVMVVTTPIGVVLAEVEVTTPIGVVLAVMVVTTPIGVVLVVMVVSDGEMVEFADGTGVGVFADVHTVPRQRTVSTLSPLHMEPLMQTLVRRW